MAKTTSEKKESLPAGHAKAGYVSSDLSEHDGTGILPPELKAWHEERNSKREEEAEAVAEHEDKIVKEERAEFEKRAKEAEKEAAPKAAAAKGT